MDPKPAGLAVFQLALGDVRGLPQQIEGTRLVFQGHLDVAVDELGADRHLALAFVAMGKRVDDELLQGEFHLEQIGFIHAAPLAKGPEFLRKLGKIVKTGQNPLRNLVFFAHKPASLFRENSPAAVRGQAFFPLAPKKMWTSAFGVG